MAKSKWNLWVKVRSALRDIYRYSPMRREAIKTAVTNFHFADPMAGPAMFLCSLCDKDWPVQMADVDHIEPCGSLLSAEDLPGFFDRLMNGKVRVICKLCHKKVTASQRKKKK